MDYRRYVLAVDQGFLKKVEVFVIDGVGGREFGLQGEDRV